MRYIYSTMHTESDFVYVCMGVYNLITIKISNSFLPSMFPLSWKNRTLFKVDIFHAFFINCHNKIVTIVIRFLPLQIKCYGHLYFSMLHKSEIINAWICKSFPSIICLHNIWFRKVTTAKMQIKYFYYSLWPAFTIKREKGEREII